MQAQDQATQRRQWDSVAAGWSRWWSTIERGAQHVSQRMLELADIEAGYHVLDIATGIGEPALSAALRVGPSGRVVATDLSPGMLAIARQRAATLQLHHVEFVEADVAYMVANMDSPDCSFDVVLCRWGVTSLPDPDGTLRAIRHLLKPNGSFVTAVWDAGTRGRPLSSLATALAQEMFGGSSSASGAVSLPGAAQHALDRQLRHAGYTDVHVEEMTLTLEWPSTAACTQYLLDVSPDLGARLADQSSVQQTEYRQRLAERLAPYTLGDERVQIPNVTLCAVGRR